jgi:hypothetical protein
MATSLCAQNFEGFACGPTILSLLIFHFTCLFLSLLQWAISCFLHSFIRPLSSFILFLSLFFSSFIVFVFPHLLFFSFLYSFLLFHKLKFLSSFLWIHSYFHLFCIPLFLSFCSFQFHCFFHLMCKFQTSLSNCVLYRVINIFMSLLQVLFLRLLHI